MAFAAIGLDAGEGLGGDTQALAIALGVADQHAVVGQVGASLGIGGGLEHDIIEPLSGGVEVDAFDNADVDACLGG